MIFLEHMIPVLEHVRSRNLIPIMWDDMMREWTIGFLKGVYGSVFPLTKNAKIKEKDFRQIFKVLSLQYGSHITQFPVIMLNISCVKVYEGISLENDLMKYPSIESSASTKALIDILTLQNFVYIL